LKLSKSGSAIRLEVDWLSADSFRVELIQFGKTLSNCSLLETSDWDIDVASLCRSWNTMDVIRVSRDLGLREIRALASRFLPGVHDIGEPRRRD